MLHCWERQNAIALLHKAHVARKGTTANCAGVILIINFGFTVEKGAISTLHPRWHVERSNMGLSTVGHCNFRVIGLADNNVLIVICRRDGATILDLRTARHGERWRSYCDAFHLSKEETLVRRLVVAHALPHHTIAILMVVPKRVDAILCGDIGSVDTQFGVVACAHYDFLAPVAKDVGRSTRIILRTIVGGAA